MTAVLELEAVEKRYRQGGAVIEVLSNVNLVVSAGEVVALTAPSGAGKTTLLQIAGLLDSPDSGRVSVAGKDAACIGDRARSRLRAAQLGFVFQFHNLLPEFTAAENIVLPQIIAGVRRNDARARAAELLGIMGLEDRATHRPAALSGGEQQRVALARALSNTPSLILADEPTGNLDAATALTVIERLIELAHQTGIAMLVATHNPTLSKLMDRQVTLTAGEIIEV